MWYVSQKHLSLLMTFLLLIFIYVQKCILDKTFLGMNRQAQLPLIRFPMYLRRSYINKYSLISKYVDFLYIILAYTFHICTLM